MSEPGDLDRIEQDVDEELALLASSHPLPITDDLTDLEAYEGRLRSLHDSVLSLETYEKNIGDA